MASTGTSPSTSTSTSTPTATATGTATAAPSSPLHYSQLWDGIKIVADQAEESKEWMTRIIRFFKEKAELDKSYSKSLKKMVEKLNPDSTTENGTFQQFLTSFKGLNSTLAVNFEILSAKIEEQVYKPLSLARDHHSAQSKKLLTESIRLTKLYNSAYENLEKSRAETIKACRELNETKKEIKAQEDVNMLQDVFSAFKSDIPTLQKKALACDQKYMAAVKHMRGFRGQFDTSMAHLLDQFQVLEQERMQSAMNHLRHYMSVQSGMLASNQKNLAAVMSVLERIDIESDIQAFIAHHKTDKQPPPLPEYELFPGHPNFRAGSLSSSSATDDTQTDSGDEEYGSEDDDIPVMKKAVVTTSDKKVTINKAPVITAGKPGANKPPPPAKPAANSGTKPPPPARKSSSAAPAPVTTSLAMATATATVEAATSVATTAASAIKSALKKTITQADVANITVGARSMHEEAAKRRASHVQEKTKERKQAEETLIALFTKITGHADINDSDAKRQITEGKDLTAEEWDKAHDLFQTADGRNAFGFVLNKQRIHNDGLRLSPLSFSLLARLTLDFLDAAKHYMHVHPAQLCMIMAQSFYREGDVDDEDEDNDQKQQGDDRKGRVYLVNSIRDHPIWKDIRFWEEAFFDSFHEKMAKHTKVARWHSDQEQAESLHTQRQIVFSSLGTFAHNMMDFGIDPNVICTFVEKMANINELEGDQLTLLRQLPCYAHATPASPSSHTSRLIDDDEDGEASFQSGDENDDTSPRISASADFATPATGRPIRGLLTDDDDYGPSSAHSTSSAKEQIQAEDPDWESASHHSEPQPEESPIR